MADLTPKTVGELPAASALDGTELLAISQGGSSKKQALEGIKEFIQESAILKPSTAFAIPASGNSISYNMAGITASHELVRFNFSASPENDPPVDLSWSTASGYFTITNNGGATDETIQPVFAIPSAVAITAHS